MTAPPDPFRKPLRVKEASLLLQFDDRKRLEWSGSIHTDPLALADLGGRSNDCRITTQPLPPESMAQDRHVGLPSPRIVRGPKPADGRRPPQHRQDVGTCGDDRLVLGHAARRPRFT